MEEEELELENILGVSDGVTATYHEMPKNPFHWKSGKKPPKRYNEDGTLAFVWVLACLYNSELKEIKPMTAKYEAGLGWVDDQNQPIENGSWRVTHWNILTPPPVFDGDLYW